MLSPAVMFTRAGGAPGAAPVGLIVPYAPLWDSLTGGSGQAVAVVLAVEELVGGDPIAGDPVTHYTFRGSAAVASGGTEASVQEGGTPAWSVVSTSPTYTRTGLAAGDYYLSVSAHNSAGESDYSFAYLVTVT